MRNDFQIKRQTVEKNVARRIITIVKWLHVKKEWSCMVLVVMLSCMVPQTDGWTTELTRTFTDLYPSPARWDEITMWSITRGRNEKLYVLTSMPVCRIYDMVDNRSTTTGRMNRLMDTPLFSYYYSPTIAIVRG